jgi:type III secretion protein R
MLLVGVIPLLAVICTAFTKIVIVLLIVRNAIGIQQTPPNIIIFSLAMILSYVVMIDVVNRSIAAMPAQQLTQMSPQELFQAGTTAAEPFRQFMMDNSTDSSRKLFQSIAAKKDPNGNVEAASYSVLVPAFVLDELTRAFRVGFMIYIPFLIIDLVASCILIAIGMQMVSVTSITVPLKILLFVEAQGWERLMEFLLLSYR